METIEEAKDKSFLDYCEENRNRVFSGFRSTRYLHFMAGFDASTEHFFSLPLYQRLTESERNEVKKLYYAAEGGASEYSRGYLTALKRIFGKNLFAEK